jgi:hypothetical protein
MVYGPPAATAWGSNFYKNVARKFKFGSRYSMERVTFVRTRAPPCHDVERSIAICRLHGQQLHGGGYGGPARH